MKEKILVVEDDIEIAFAIKEFLAKKRYAITWTSTGKEGLEEFQKNKYDLVIVDIMMPEMDGFTLCKNIRMKSDIPILIMSAKSQEKDKVKGLNIGADDYITKPFSLVELEARIDSHIRRYKRYLGENKEEKIIQYKDGLKLYKDLEEIELNDKKLHFTIKEYSLLALLIKTRIGYFPKRNCMKTYRGK
ncbi:two-component response regulator [Gottschalkia acidurici 9a]|uniref:Two-component response regulator n=1 Tax=Gottschalkia acidurici (strain ATCC 7906 / DSM 604 / BCRC 14475 / CIP 104303 / KCTC 5404 / NCIMB 10678 / 9a) TaxID=1128398 RepID=K0B401_GOTA9|nr:response regulator transcription factor [Gottschalkia acidurici]AFS79296.1 two-component response regulator [Gottschalkia acidurici 9a]